MIDEPSLAFDTDTGATVFPTNRQNLLQILSSGLIGPRETYGKYYEDLLEMVPGWVPLVRTPISADVLQAASHAEDETSFPVLVEVDPLYLGVGKMPTLDASGNTSDIIGDGSWTALAYPAVLPRDAIRRVHFRSERDLEEHVLREYINVNHAEWEMVVTPEYFDSGKDGQVLQWLMSVPPGEFDQAIHQGGDSLTGAIAAIAASTPGDLDALKILADLLNGVDPGKSAGLLRLGLLRPGSTIKPSGANEVVVRSTIEVLHQTNPDDGWSGPRILDEVRMEIAKYRLSKRDEQAVSNALDKVADIVEMRRDFQPFKSTGLDSVKALLLVLLRDDPARLLRWDAAETGASALVTSLACAFGGTAHGRTKLNTAMRPSILDRRLSMLAVQPGFVKGTGSGKTVVPEVSVKADEVDLKLVLSGETLLVRRRPALPIAELLAEADRKDPNVMKAFNMIVDRMQWSTCVKFQVTVPGDGAGVTVEVIDGAVRFAFDSVLSWARSIDSVKVLDQLAEVDLPDDLDAAVRSVIA